MRQMIRIVVPVLFLLTIAYVGWAAYARPSASEKECPQGECDYARY